jgi:DNA-directed RNA polymerase specialized sigma24 family protein
MHAVGRAPLEGRPDDIALVALALIEGLAAAEVSQRLGSSRGAVERRWNTGIRALLAGFGH